jgi:hypothetical protein
MIVENICQLARLLGSRWELQYENIAIIMRLGYSNNKESIGNAIVENVKTSVDSVIVVAKDNAYR